MCTNILNYTRTKSDTYRHDRHKNVVLIWYGNYSHDPWIKLYQLPQWLLQLLLLLLEWVIVYFLV